MNGIWAIKKHTPGIDLDRFLLEYLSLRTSTPITSGQDVLDRLTQTEDLAAWNYWRQSIDFSRRITPPMVLQLTHPTYNAKLVLKPCDLPGKDCPDVLIGIATLEMPKPPAGAPSNPEPASSSSTALDDLMREIRTPLSPILGFSSLLVEKETDPRLRDYALHIHQSADRIRAILDKTSPQRGPHDPTTPLGFHAWTLSAFATEIRAIFSQIGLSSKAFAVDPELANMDDAYSIATTNTQTPPEKVLKSIRSICDLLNKGEIIAAALFATNAPQGARNLLLSITTRCIPHSNDADHLEETRIQLASICSQFSISSRGEGIELTLSLGLRIPNRNLVSGHTNATAPFTTSPHVLIVEDNIMNQKVIKSFLSELGCSSSIASNGIDALDSLSRDHFDAVIMDISMPEMDGFSTTTAIRSLTDNVRNIPIIAVTAHTSHDIRERCLSSGFNDYLSKPITLEDLSLSIQRALNLPLLPA